jgi:hypothetical protein
MVKFRYPFFDVSVRVDERGSWKFRGWLSTVSRWISINDPAKVSYV